MFIYDFIILIAADRETNVVEFLLIVSYNSYNRLLIVINRFFIQAHDRINRYDNNYLHRFRTSK